MRSPTTALITASRAALAAPRCGDPGEHGDPAAPTVDRVLDEELPRYAEPIGLTGTPEIAHIHFVHYLSYQVTMYVLGGSLTSPFREWLEQDLQRRSSSQRTQVEAAKLLSTLALPRRPRSWPALCRWGGAESRTSRPPGSSHVPLPW